MNVGADEKATFSNGRTHRSRLQIAAGNGQRDQAQKAVAFYHRVCRKVGACVKNGLHLLRAGKIRPCSQKRQGPLGNSQIGA